MIKRISLSSKYERSLRLHMFLLLAVSLCLLLGIGGWAASTNLSSAVIASGTVIIEGSAKKVQHLTGGIVRQLLVREGDQVVAGQLLVTLDGRVVEAERAVIANTLALLYVRRSRLYAERTGTEPVQDQKLASVVSAAFASKLSEEEQKYLKSRRAALTVKKDQLRSRIDQLQVEVSGLASQIESYDNALAVIASELSNAEKLYIKKLMTLQQVNALRLKKSEIEGDRGSSVTQRAQVGGKISETELQIIQVDEDRRSEIDKELSEVEAKIAEFEVKLASVAKERMELDIVAPSSGRVLQQNIHTVGGIVAPGETLMSIVPQTEQLIVDAKVAIYDIDKISVGQPVNIRFSAFDQRTPEIGGEVYSVAADAVLDQARNVFYYPVRIKPSAINRKAKPSLALYPGMPAEVFIKIADRSVLSYLAKPFTDQLERSLREE